MRSAHKEAQSEAKSLPSRRERRVGTVRTGGFSGNEYHTRGSRRFSARANGEHKGTTRASSSLALPALSSSLPPPESEFYVLHTDESTCATARDTRFLSRSSPCHFPSSALSSALTPLEAAHLRHFPGRAGKQATSVMSISWRRSSSHDNTMSNLAEWYVRIASVTNNKLIKQRDSEII